VEAVRYDGLLEVQYDTPHTEFRLPPLTLQPIVENAVKHGMNRERAVLLITVQTRKTGDGSQIVIEDNGPGFDPEQEPSPPDGGAKPAQEACIGLANVRGRLELVCGGSLGITPRPGGGTIVTIRIPDRPQRRESSDASV
jgi:sensor histidine kinase YesM